PPLPSLAAFATPNTYIAQQSGNDSVNIRFKIHKHHRRAHTSCVYRKNRLDSSMVLMTVHSSGEMMMRVLGGSIKQYYNSCTSHQKAKHLRYTRALLHELIDLWDHLSFTQNEELMMHNVHLFRVQTAVFDVGFHHFERTFGQSSALVGPTNMFKLTIDNPD
ncbi:hypothetical protein D0863_04165, partial [Hortaea werneckii]